MTLITVMPTYGYLLKTKDEIYFSYDCLFTMKINLLSVTDGWIAF